MKYTIMLLTILLTSSLYGQIDTVKIIESLSKEWNIDSKTKLQTIVQNHESVNKKINVREKENIDLVIQLNKLFLIKALKNHIIYSDHYSHEASKLNDQLAPVNLKDPVLAVASYTKALNFVTDDYFFLQNLKAGHAIEASNGGGKINTSMKSSFNELFYNNLLTVYQEGALSLKQLYLKKVASIFKYYGYTDGLEQLLPYIKAMPASEARDQVLEAYESYAHLKAGQKAPDFALPDDRGKVYSLADFKGKVLVIDVWATWCTWCIKKMPAYLTIFEKYKNHNDIAFLTISIDEQAQYSHWKYSLPHYHLMDLINLFACKEKYDFIKNYNITGVPRYIIIDKKGNIVNVYTPGPEGVEFEATILKAL